MQNNIKVLLAFMAALAVLSVFSFFDVLGGVKSALLSDGAQPLPIPAGDADNDGLYDGDESYWETNFQNPDTDGDGFLDGEEVVSGHDPLKPAPDDILLNQNITQRTADLAIAGLVEGSLKPGSVNYETSLNQLAEYIMTDAVENLTPKIETGNVSLVDSSKENQEAYVKSLRDILGSFIKTVNDQVLSMQSSNSELFLTEDNSQPDPEFMENHEKFKKIFDQTLAIPVPDNWRDFHLALLVSSGQISEINKILAHRAEDPVKAAAAFSILSNVYESIPSLIESFSKKIAEENITIGQ